MNKGRFSWRARGRSFLYAFSGVKMLLCSEHNMWLHAGAAMSALLLGLLLGLSATEWVAIVLCIGGVMMAEGFNSAIEALADLVCPGVHPLVKRAKDIAAAAVLIMAVAALATGCIIFIPKIMALCV